MTATSNKTYTGSEREGVFKQNGRLSPSRSENESEIVVLVNAEGMVTYISPSITSFLGYTPEEIVEDHMRVLVHPDNFVAILQAPGTTSLDSQRLHEYRLRCKNGSWRWFEGSTTNLLQVPGIEAIVGTFRAISQQRAERKAAEERLILSENRYRYLAAIVESSDDAILSKDLDGIITSWNAAAERMFGYSAQEIIGQPVSRLFLPQRQDEFAQIMSRIRQGERVDHFETKRVRKNGVILTVSVTVSPVKDRIGTIIGASDITRDITQQRQLEAKFRQLFDSNLIGVFVLDFAGTFLEANDALLNLLGYTQAELQAGVIEHDTLTPPEFRLLNQAAMETLRETGSFGPYEKEYLHKSGRRIPVLLAATRIAQTETCLGFALDITERKELDKRKDEFISMASHELKTPITSLKGFLNLLQRSLAAQGDEKVLHYLARMNTQVNKLTNLINDLLDLSKMHAGQLAYREERFEMDALVQEIMENVQETTQTHHLLLEGQTQAEVLGDRDRIGQVLINLLNNAIKYSPQADTVRVRVSRDQDNVLVSVQDFGVGIAKEHQQRIFERFYQVTDHEEKTYTGLGIGLYISLDIVKRHGGRVWVESKKGKGSTFYFTLPLMEKEGE